jgi:hypothetical protein
MNKVASADRANCVAGHRGIALLEVLVTLVILALAGAAMIRVLSQSVLDADATAQRELEMAAVERALVTASMLDRSDLLDRLGSRTLGEFVMHVERPERYLFRIAVARLETPDVEELVTVVFRPDTLRGSQRR